MKRFGVYVILFSLLLCGILSFATSQEEYTIYNRAQGYFQQGRALGDEDLVKSARGDLLSFISKYPNSDLYPDALILLGDVQYYLGAYEDAKSAYNRALSKLEPVKDERYPYVLYSLAWTQYKAKNIDAARANFEKLSKVSSDYQSNALFMIGMMYMDAVDYDSAAESFKKAADIGKGEILAQSLYNYAYCMMKKGYKEKALEYFEKAATASSAPVISGKSYYQAALLLYKKDPSAAESFLKKATGLLRGSEDEKDALFFMGSILSKEKRYVEAISTYKKILSLNLSDEYKAKVYYELGWNYYDMGEKYYLDSTLAFSKAFNLKSSIWADAGFQLAYVYVSQGMYTKAREVYIKLSSGLAGSSLKYQALIEKGRMEIKLGRYNDAINTLLTVSKTSEKEYALKGNYWLALAYYSMKKYKDSTSLLDQILSSECTNELKAKAYYLYGEIYFANKNYDKAIEKFMNVVDLGVREVIDNAYYSIAISYYAQHKFNDAKKYFSIVLNRYPNSETVLDTYYYLSEISRVQGDINTAFKYYNEILSIDKNKVYFYDVLVKKAEMLKTARKFNELEDYTKKAIKEYPESPKIEWLKYYLGEAYLNMHDYDEAYTLMTGLLKESKTSDVKSGALYGIARYYSVQGNISKAEDYYKNLLSNYPLSVKAPWASLDLALLYYNKNEMKNAKMMFFKTIFTYPDFEKNDACYFYIAQIYEREKAYDKAIKTYQELIKKFPNSPKVPDARKRIEEISAR